MACKVSVVISKISVRTAHYPHAISMFSSLGKGCASFEAILQAIDYIHRIGEGRCLRLTRVYDVFITKKGYQTVVMSITIADGDRYELNVYLVKDITASSVVG